MRGNVVQLAPVIEGASLCSPRGVDADSIERVALEAVSVSVSSRSVGGGGGGGGDAPRPSSVGGAGLTGTSVATPCGGGLVLVDTGPPCMVDGTVPGTMDEISVSGDFAVAVAVGGTGGSIDGRAVFWFWLAVEGRLDLATVDTTGAFRSRLNDFRRSLDWPSPTEAVRRAIVGEEGSRRRRAQKTIATMTIATITTRLRTASIATSSIDR